MYCDCLRAGIECGERCGCVNCYNCEEGDVAAMLAKGPFRMPKARPVTAGSGEEEPLEPADAGFYDPNQASPDASEERKPKKQKKTKKQVSSSPAAPCAQPDGNRSAFCDA